MAKIDLISKQWCDLVFEGRNKEYGAYRLRAHAGKRNMYAFFTLCALVAAIFALIGLVNLAEKAVEAFEDESATELSQLEEVEEDKEEKKEPEKPKEPEPEQKKEETPQENQTPDAAVEAVAARATETFTTVAIVDKVDESRELSSQQNLQDSRAAFSNRTYHGDAGGTVVATAGMNVGGTSHDPNAGRGVIGGKGTSTGDAVRKADTEIYSESGVAVMAQFPGGEGALIAFMNKTVKYPQIAVEQDLQGTVYLRFVVEKDGSIGEVRVTKSLSKECDQAAITALKKAPRFSPAKNERGEPVRVWFNFPVRFEIH